MFRVIKLKYILIIFLIFTILFSIFFLSAQFVKADEAEKDDYIKWVDFSVPYTVLDKTYNLNVKSHNENYPVKYNWIELISYLSAKYFGNLNQFKQSDLDNLISSLNNGKTMDDLTQDMQYYDYYLESYTAVLGGFVGEYEIQVDNTKTFEKRYGLKAFSPIARGYSFTHYDDFGNSRSYGYNRKHLGNDLMGNIGTPIIAVESGYVEALGWNQYGGWRIGIRSFDKKRYYYYAHLRKDHPYNSELVEGSIVTAGEVIGYLGMTGYSARENVNNINVPHLHFGLQLIFDESQKDGVNQIWVDVYTLVEFLRKNTSKVYYDSDSKEYFRQYDMFEDFNK